ncbi:serine/threonine-protein kinase [Actinoplanes sp. URMC 104]|uniref:serine/threonine-protein kinase n=1 Tax=Actinoplanes sp. URMC 104 TaxID=3423409 RepID=UPI003F19C916
MAMADEEQLGRDYRLREEIGRGPTAVVRRATSTLGGADYAAKLFGPDFAADQRVREVFLREETVLRELRHENIVGVRGVVVEQVRIALLREYVDGVNLRQHQARRGGVLPATEAAGIAAQVAAALAAAHARGISHLSLVPENVLVTGGDPVTVRVTDFGLTTLMWDAGRPANLTNGYAAPELWTGGAPTPAADLYSLGAIFLELVTGMHPGAGGPGLSAVPPQLRPLVQQMLSADPAQRPSASTAAAQFRAAAPSSAAAGYPTGAGYATGDWPTVADAPLWPPPPMAPPFSAPPSPAPPYPGPIPPHPASAPPYPGATPPHPASAPPFAASAAGSPYAAPDQCSSAPAARPTFPAQSAPASPSVVSFAPQDKTLHVSLTGKHAAILAAVIAVVAVAVLAFRLGDANGNDTMAQPTPTATATTTPSPTPTTAPTDVVAPPVTKETVGYPSRETYASRLPGGWGTIYIAVRDGTVVAYLCDGNTLEAWFKGSIDGGDLTASSKKTGGKLTGSFSAGRLSVEITVEGETHTYQIPAVKKPSGLYRASGRVRNAEVSGGWIVLSDGSQVGVLAVGGTPQPAPRLDTTSKSATVDGTAVSATEVDVQSGTGF